MRPPSGSGARRRVPGRAVAALAAALAAGLALAPVDGGVRAAGDDIGALEATLAGTEHAKREEAIARLKGIGGARATKAILRVLPDADWAVSIAAARALGELGARDAVEPLARLAIEGEIQWVRDAAMAALRAVDAEGATPRLLQAARSTQDMQQKARCIEAAGVVGGAALLKGVRDHLTAKDPEVFATAVRALGRAAAAPDARAEAIPILARVLALRGERKQFVAYAAAVEALAAIDADDARRLLVGEILQAPDDDGFAPERIARGFLAMPPDAVRAAVLEGFRQARSPEQARRLSRLVARMRLGGCGPALAPLLEHREERVRSEAAWALGAAAEESSRGPLERAFEDRSPRVRREVVTALARVMDAREFRSFSGRVAGDPDVEVRVQYVVEIADAGDPKGIPVLDQFAADAHWRVSSAALASIGTLGVAEDLPLVQKRLADRDWRVRGAAYEALGRLRAKDAIPLLAKGLADRDPVVRGVCLANLQILTREKLGGDAKPWMEWFAANGPDFHPVKRSRRSAEERRKEAEATRYAHEVRKYGVEILQKARIVVVEGAWDKVQLVLGHLSIPHTLLRAQQLKDSGLNPNQIVLVNCEGNVDRDTAERLQWFVNVGGYLMSTDWALTKAVQVCFPGYVKQFSGANTGNDVVVVEEALPGHPFTRDVFTDVPAMMWWLEIQAFPIAPEYPERCEVIVDSREMRRRYGSSPMATSFRWGLGKVQHSLSHFYLQEEGMQKAAKPRDRMIFAADNLGLSLPTIRKLDAEGRFGGRLNEETMKLIAPDYSMFRLIVNVVAEKSKWVEDL